MYFSHKTFFVYKLIEFGFSKYNGSPSRANGYELEIANNPPRFVRFYDNNFWADDRIEFRVMDYGRINEYEFVPFLFFFKKKVQRETCRYDIYSEYFTEEELTGNKILQLIEFAKTIK